MSKTRWTGAGEALGDHAAREPGADDGCWVRLDALGSWGIANQLIDPLRNLML
jgi:hypothetical protein